MTFRRDLLPHPADVSGPAAGIRADVERAGNRLILRFALAGDVASIRLPDARGPHRAEGLWQHTCFEVFLKRPGHEDYLEFNFAPFGPWAAYHFDGYRSGKRDLVVAAPSVGGMTGPDVLSMFISLKVPPSAWDIGFSAVIEDMDGHISYWALAHPSAKPDFHHPDSFALPFPGPST
jgi:hypothetical protein